MLCQGRKFFLRTQLLTSHADDWHLYVCNANIILCIKITLTNLSHRLLIRHLRRSVRWSWRISYRIRSHISSKGRRILSDNSPDLFIRVWALSRLDIIQYVVISLLLTLNLCLCVCLFVRFVLK